MRLANRQDFPNLFASLGASSVAEIGVAAGRFSKVLLSTPSLTKLYLIDNWKNDRGEINKPQALELAASNPDIIAVIEKSSEEAATMFEPNSIDCVYLDAMHDYDSVSRDIALWWPIAKLCLAGHDYSLWNPATKQPIGVMLAVEEFAHRELLEVCVTGVMCHHPIRRLRAAYRAGFASPKNWGDSIPSWWILKPQKDIA